MLVVYAACWAVALFAPSADQIGARVAGFVLSTIAAAWVLVLWTVRPAFRPGVLFRDIWLPIILALAIAQAGRAPIRHLGLLGLFDTIEHIAIFLTAVHLCMRRPQPLFVVTLVLLAGSTFAAASRPQQMALELDPVILGLVTAVTFLAFLPWFVPRRMCSARRWYHWLVAAVSVILLTVAASGVLTRNGTSVEAALAAFPGETRDFIVSVLRRAPLLGCGPGHYDAIFRATVPEDFAGQSAAVPGVVVLLVERGGLGLAAMILFCVAMLWRFRPGPWAVHHAEVLEMARPLRWAAAFAFVLLLAAPSSRTAFGQLVPWCLFGTLRAWSSRQRAAAVALLTGRPDMAAMAVPRLDESGAWSTRQVFLFLSILVGGSVLVFFELRPWIAVRRRRCPPTMARHDPAFLRRIESSLWWWPYFPRTHELVAVHYRAKVDAGLGISRTEIDAVTQAYRGMIWANPYDPLSHDKLAVWYIRQWKALKTDLREAAKAARRGLEYCPGSFELRYLLAGIYRDLGETEKARSAYEQARRLRPRSRAVLQNLAELARRSGDPDAAEHYLLLARQVPPIDQGEKAQCQAVTGKQSDHND